ncbi:MAG: zinc ribbon domain-containing protein [Anaerolineaceae bacterium]
MADKRLAEIARLLSENQIVLIAEKQKAEADKQAENAKKALKSIEDAVEKIQIKIQTSEASLYGGKIRLPKELQDLQNEITSLKKHLSSQEDLELEAIMALEQAEKDAAISSLELEKVKADFTGQTSALRGEKSALDKKKERLLSERGAAISPIQSDFLAIYDRFRVQKRGVAIAGVSEDSCSACGAGLTPANLQAARSNQQIVYCPQCGRMLYGG